MMDPTAQNILRRTWERSTGSSIFLPQAVYRGLWWEGQALDPTSGLVSWYQQDGFDAYFSVLTFNGDERRMDNAPGDIGLMWLDLDYIPQDENPLKYLRQAVGAYPTFLWSTSPGHYQAIYFTNAVPLFEWKPLAKALTDRIEGADPGGWHPTKVLRVPLSVNYKRGGHKGHIVYQNLPNPRIYDPWELARTSEALTDPMRSLGPELMPGPISDDDRLRLLVREWQRLPLGVQHWLTLSEEQYPYYAPRDRSLLIRGLLLQMKAAGIEALTAFHLISGRPFDKFRDRPQDLWHEVLKAFGLA